MRSYIKSYCFLSACDPQTHDREELEQKERYHESIRRSCHNRKNLYQQLPWIAEEQPVCPGAIDHFLRKHTGQERACQASHAVCSPHIERVVDLHPLGA